MAISGLGRADLTESFVAQVINGFNVPVAGSIFGYIAYLGLPETLRSNDEADVVDIRFSERALEWLGFHKDQGHYTYNRTSQSLKDPLRPDFAVHGSVGTAFIWEDKNTTETFDESHVDQLKRYVVGTSGYAIWCNARHM
jgi:hypothetical protein